MKRIFVLFFLFLAIDGKAQTLSVQGNHFRFSAAKTDVTSVDGFFLFRLGANTAEHGAGPGVGPGVTRDSGAPG